MKNKVYLVGAGPGDEGLVTVKALALIERADVLVYDRLIAEGLIERAKEGCEKIYVGKAAADHALPQQEINALLHEKAKAGKTVVRLKGGDPYVFGRGGEEGIYLVERGIEVEVVPGVTSAVAGPCYAGIPITHRDWSSSFHVFTGNFKDELHGLDFDTIAKLKGTLVFLMGFGNLPYITEGLMAAGKEKDTPVAVVSHGTTRQQKTAVGTLANIGEEVAKACLTTPALTVIGPVVHCREKLNFFESRRERGVLVLRDRNQSGIFREKLERAGFDPLVFPVLRIRRRPLDGEGREIFRRLASFDWIVFTSPNGVESFFSLYREFGGDWRAFSPVKFAVIGKATGEVLREKGFCADFIPDAFVSERLAASLASRLKGGESILLPRSAIADNDMVKILSEKGSVCDWKLYDTEIATENRDALRRLLAGNSVAYIPFTSASTVDGLMEALGGDAAALAGKKLISIGPVTGQRMKEHGLPVYREAKEHSLDGIIGVLEEERC